MHDYHYYFSIADYGPETLDEQDPNRSHRPTLIRPITIAKIPTTEITAYTRIDWSTHYSDEFFISLLSQLPFECAFANLQSAALIPFVMAHYEKNKEPYEILEMLFQKTYNRYVYIEYQNLLAAEDKL